MRRYLLLPLVAFALLLTAQPAQAHPAWTTDRENTIAWAVLRLVNRERASAGVPRVWMGYRVRLAAHRHNLEMARYDSLSHRLPGEPWLGERLVLAGFDWSYCGENIGWNSDMTATGVLELERLMFAETPPNDDHRVNILDRQYYRAGVDVLFDWTHRRVWLTVDFARHA